MFSINFNLITALSPYFLRKKYCFQFLAFFKKYFLENIFSKFNKTHFQWYFLFSLKMKTKNTQTKHYLIFSKTQPFGKTYFLYLLLVQIKLSAVYLKNFHKKRGFVCINCNPIRIQSTWLHKLLDLYKITMQACPLRGPMQT